MVFVPAYVMVGQYFDKHKGKAMALATMGSGLGNVAFAPAIDWFFDFYGYFGAMILLGACQLHNAVAGALYRPLVITESKKNILCVEKESKVIVLERLNIENDTAAADIDPHVTDTHHSTAADLDPHVTDTHHSAVADHCPQAENTHHCSPSDEVDAAAEASVHQRGCAPTSLWCNRTFLLYCFLMMSMQTCIMTFLVFLPAFSVELGVDRAMAAVTLTVFGLSDMVGRFLFGFLFDLRSIRPKRQHFYCFVSAMFGACVLSMCFAPNFAVVCVISAVTAVFEGATHSQRATVVSEIVYAYQLPTAVGVIICCQGVGNLCGPPLAGYLRDVTSTSRFGFVYCGLLLLIASLLFFVNVVCHTPRHNSSNLRDNT